MLNGARAIQAELFAALPDRLRRPVRSAWADANRGGVPADSFLEGPCFDASGRLYVTDIPHGRIFRISVDGEWDTVTEYDGWPNGLKLGRDGQLVVADYRRGILKIDPTTGTVETLVRDVNSEALKGVNDLCFAPNGDLYFTDQGQTGLHDPTGRVYRVTPAGRLERLIGTIPSPNGIVYAPALGHLYVAVTRANAVWRLPLIADGTVSKAGTYLNLSGGIGPDGLALDAEGGLIVAHPGLTVWRFNALGLPTHYLEPLGLHFTNVAFGGPDRRTLYITESQSGRIFRANMLVPGA